MITFNNVSFSYKNQENEGIKHINLTINDGETVLFCGESGCGKSTILRLVNGLIPHYYEGSFNGELLIHGKNMRKEPLYEIAKTVGSVFQNPRTQFFNAETTSEIVFGCENMALPPKEIDARLEDTVKRLNINNLLDRSLFELSGGEKQKIACAGADIILPNIFVLDEPSSNLDIKTIADLGKVMEHWKSLGKTIIIAEHRLYYVIPFADKIVYMKKGEIKHIYTRSELLSLCSDDLEKMGLRSLHPFPLDVNKEYTMGKDKFELNNIIFSYRKNQRLITNINNLSLPKSEIIGILGDNGAGKSTFARCVCGLNNKEKGHIIFDNQVYKAKKRNKISYMVMQDVNHQLFTDNVLEEVLISMSDIQSEKSRKEATFVLECLDLLDKKDRHPMSLSGGEKQRVAIASAIASNKQILAFDEPTSGLDYRHMLEVSEGLKKLKSMGKSILLITHDPELIYHCCTYILFLQQGKALWHDHICENTLMKVNEFLTQ